MKILVCPDKYKGTLTSRQAADAIVRGLKESKQRHVLRVVTLADGGEGTVAAAVEAGGRPMPKTVHGPRGESINAEWALMPDGTAVIESAQACGLELIEKPSVESSLRSSSFGVGELIRAALDASCTRIVLGLGGVASSDGGAGLLQALGAQLMDKAGIEIDQGGGQLAYLHSVDLDSVDSRLWSVPVVLATDVRNPLLGASGAARVFGPQKGADEAAVLTLEGGLKRFASLLESRHPGLSSLPGTGAAGGIPLAVLGVSSAVIESGFDVIAEFTGILHLVEDADLVITGEGSLDQQSLQGKGPVAVAQRCKQTGVPVLALPGRALESERVWKEAGFAFVETLEHLAGSGSAALANPARYLSEAATVALARWQRELTESSSAL